MKKEAYINTINSLSAGDFEDVDAGIITVVSGSGNKVIIKDNDVDIAMQYAQGNETLELDPKYEKKLLRKIDWWLLPLIAALSSCQLMDKTTNSYASIMGMRTDLSMTSNQYSWVGSIFYFGYLFAEYPANLALQKLPLSKTVSSAVIIWGVILMCHAACQSSGPFLACRYLLGTFEAFMNPAYILLTSQWWKKEEQFMRSCIWFGFQGFGTLVGAGISHGLVTYRTGEHAFASWRLLFIITGLITIFLGILSMIHIPDIPTKAWFLNDLDKKYVVERIRGNQQGFGNKHYKKSQLIEAFTDPIVYLYFIYGISYSIANAAFSNFGSILLNQDFGFPTATALLMNMPGGAIDIIFPPIIAMFNYKFMKNRRLYSCAITNAVVVVGMCLFNFTHHKGSRLTGYFSFYVATVVISGMISNVSSNVAGYTKKTTVNTVFLVGYALGNIVGPQTFIGAEAPHYRTAKAILLAAFTTGTICIISMICIYHYRNNRRDKERAALGDMYIIPENVEFADLTDKENPEFRYSL